MAARSQPRGGAAGAVPEPRGRPLLYPARRPISERLASAPPANQRRSCRRADPAPPPRRGGKGGGQWERAAPQRAVAMGTARPIRARRLLGGSPRRQGGQWARSSVPMETAQPMGARVLTWGRSPWRRRSQWEGAARFWGENGGNRAKTERMRPKMEQIGKIRQGFNWRDPARGPGGAGPGPAPAGGGDRDAGGGASAGSHAHRGGPAHPIGTHWDP